MPKGKHKGGKRCFTNFEELDKQRNKEEKEKAWRKARGDEDGDTDEEEENSDETSSEESGSSSEDENGQAKAKGISDLIEISNPNHAAQKTKKVTELTDDSPKPELSRREKEEIDKQRQTANYRRLHAQGKTEEARSDLERLAIIRKQREDANKRKEEEKKAKEATLQAKKDQVAKVLNKKDKTKS